MTHESIREIFEEICAVEIEDDVEFEIVDISDIREGDDYPGIRVALNLKRYYPAASQIHVRGTSTMYIFCIPYEVQSAA